jgi:hypothetical protein
MGGGTAATARSGRAAHSRFGGDEPFKSSFWADDVEDAVARSGIGPGPTAEAHPFKWHRSVAVRTFVFAFVATHVPLLALVALLVHHPELMSPLNMLLLMFAATLLATAFVMACLWRQFLPLRAAADGLRDFMLKGEPLRLTPGVNDEVGRLVRILVLAFAHLDRSRGPLLQAGGMVLLDRAQRQGDGTNPTPRTMALIEADQWQQVEESGDLDGMMELQTTLNRALVEDLRGGETLLPWGRGRYLLMIDGRGSDVVERLHALNRGLIVSCLREPLTFTAAVEGRGSNATGWASSLQRLEHKLFSMRLEGRRADVR